MTVLLIASALLAYVFVGGLVVGALGRVHREMAIDDFGDGHGELFALMVAFWPPLALMLALFLLAKLVAPVVVIAHRIGSGAYWAKDGFVKSDHPCPEPRGVWPMPTLDEELDNDD